MFIDSHCHLTYEPLISNIPEIIRKCKDSDVTNLLTIGTNIESSIQCSKISKQYKNIYSSIGIHPLESPLDVDNDSEIKKLYNQNSKNIAYGETGLDFFHSIEHKVRQIDLFETHIKYAKEDNATIIVHTRDAEDETLSIIKNNSKNNDTRFLIHCFTGSISFAKSLLDVGCYISFSGIITFKNSIDLQNAARYVPLDRILIETDSPYLSPEPHRGKKNSPENVIYVAKKIAELKNIQLKEVSTHTSNNFFNVFNLKI
jgi:TatD DNase family protein